MEVNKKLEICMGFIPTTIRRPRRKARLLLPEPENNQLLTSIKKINIVVKKTKSIGISVPVNVLNRNAQQSKNA